MMVCLKKVLFYVQSISIYIIDTADYKDNQLPLDATDYKVRIIHSNEFCSILFHIVWYISISSNSDAKC